MEKKELKKKLEKIRGINKSLVSEKEKECPFRKGLECEGCRLFQAYGGTQGIKVCPFMRMP